MIFTLHITDKALIFRVGKEYLQIIRKRQPNKI